MSDKNSLPRGRVAELAIHGAIIAMMAVVIAWNPGFVALDHSSTGMLPVITTVDYGSTSAWVTFVLPAMSVVNCLLATRSLRIIGEKHKNKVWLVNVIVCGAILLVMGLRPQLAIAVTGNYSPATLNALGAGGIASIACAAAGLGVSLLRLKIELS